MGISMVSMHRNMYGNNINKYIKKSDYAGCYTDKLAERQESQEKNRATIKRLLKEAKNQNSKKSGTGNKTVNGILEYAQSIQTSRAKAKEKAMQVKKLKYNFKSMSSKILSSKTSYSAKQVVGQARREVIRLKNQRQTGKYDNEELQIAITHAQAMERLAKKKARHLLEEEMAIAANHPCMGDVKEKEDIENEDDALNEDIIQDENIDDYEEMASDIEEMQDDYADFDEMEAMEEFSAEEMQAMMEAFFAEMAEEMKELMEEMGLEDLFEAFSGGSGEDMDPADIKMMKLKHRNSEMKDLVKADSDYLKAMFDKFEREKAMSAANIGGSNNGSQMPNFTSPELGAYAQISAQVPEVSVDITI